MWRSNTLVKFDNEALVWVGIQTGQRTPFWGLCLYETGISNTEITFALALGKIQGNCKSLMQMIKFC